MIPTSCTPILAFGHQSRVGKDTAARAVVRALDPSGSCSVALHTSFAARLKEAALGVFGHYGLCDAAFYERPDCEHLRDVPLPGIGKTPVELWIEFGQVVRGIYAPTWYEAALSRARPGRLLVISDLRFQNEADAVRAAGGWCVKVERPGNPVRGSDEMIAPDFEWDVVIQNNADLAALEAAAVGVANAYLDGLRAR